MISDFEKNETRSSDKKKEEKSTGRGGEGGGGRRPRGSLLLFPLIITPRLEGRAK